MSNNFWSRCDYKDVKFYCTEEEDFVEVLTEKQLKTRYSSYVSYIDNSVRVSNVRRNLL